MKIKKPGIKACLAKPDFSIPVETADYFFSLLPFSFFFAAI